MLNSVLPVFNCGHWIISHKKSSWKRGIWEVLEMIKSKACIAEFKKLKPTGVMCISKG